MAQVYGIHAVDSLLRRRSTSVQELLLQDTRTDQRLTALAELAANQGVAVSYRSRRVLDEMAQGRHQGAVALTREGQQDAGGGSTTWQEQDLFLAVENNSAPLLLLVLDGVTDPHNLGACLRSADAAGVDAVIVPKDRSADLNATVRKVACGAAESVPFVRVTNLARTLDGLKQRGVWLYGAAGEASQLLYQCDLSGSVALIMGAEGAGLRRLTRERCDFLVKLPMAGAVSSLNVSVAAGVCLFEVVRQRAGSACVGGTNPVESATSKIRGPA